MQFVYIQSNENETGTSNCKILVPLYETSNLSAVSIQTKSAAMVMATVIAIANNFSTLTEELSYRCCSLGKY